MTSRLPPANNGDNDDDDNDGDDDVNDIIHERIPSNNI